MKKLLFCLLCLMPMFVFADGPHPYQNDWHATLSKSNPYAQHFFHYNYGDNFPYYQTMKIQCYFTIEDGNGPEKYYTIIDSLQNYTGTQYTIGANAGYNDPFCAKIENQFSGKPYTQVGGYLSFTIPDAQLETIYDTKIHIACAPYACG